MTIITTQSRIIYAGDGVSTSFPIPFEFFLNSDITAVKTAVSGAVTTLVQTVDYNLSGANTPSGGTALKTTPLLTGETMALFLNPPIEQESHYPANNPFPASTLENDLDRQTQISQRLADQLSRALRAPDGDPLLATSGFMLPSGIARANTYLTFDANGNPAASLTLPPGTTLSLASITALTGAQTPAEAAASVTPTFKQYVELDPRRYGFVGDGVTNDFAAINTAILVAQKYSSARITFPPNSNVLCNTGLTWDKSKVAIDLNGSILSFVNMVTGVALTPTSSQATQNLGALSINAHPLQNGVIVGPGVTLTAVSAVSLTSAGNTIAGAMFKNLAFREFSTDVTFGNNQFCQTFENCLFTLTAGVATTYSIISNSGTNNGERYAFVNCWWFNKPLLINQLSGTADIFIRGGSMDSFQSAVQLSGGSVFLDGVHIESPGDTANWFTVSTNGVLVLKGCELILDANKTAFPMFNSDSSNTNGGVFLDDCYLAFGAFTYSAGSGAVFGPVLIGGTGNARVRNLIQPAGSNHPAIASALNLLAYPGFENVNLAAEWTLTGGAAQSTTVAHSGTHSLAVPGASTGNALTTQPCQPGQFAQGNFWYQIPTVGFTGFFNCILSYVDKGGNTLASVNIFSVVATVAGWTQQQFKNTTPAPFGTVSATLLVNWTAGATGTPIGYIDDVLFNVA